MAANVPPPRFYGGGRLTTTPPGYDDQDSAEAQRERHERAWSNLIFKIRYYLTIALTLTAAIIAIAALLILGWFIVLLIVHYTIPQLGWLTPKQLERITGTYGTFTSLAAPAILATNAWLVAYFGSRRWFGSNNN